MTINPGQLRECVIRPVLRRFGLYSEEKVHEMRYFSPNEFACPHCGEGADKMDSGLLQHLDAARHMAGIPFVINSAYRCEKHNKAVGGVEGSAHTKGTAVDIAASGSRERFIIAHALLARGLARIGVAESFVHVDVDSGKDQQVMWLYD